MSLSDFTVNTDYPMDKIVYLKEASYTFDPAVNFGSILIEHGLPFKPLPTIQWSFTPDFSVSYEDNIGPFPGPSGFPFTITLVIEADGPNILIRSNSTIGAQLLYVRIFCFPPSDYVGEAEGTASIGDDFIVTTDKNYMKLIDQNKVAVASGASVSIPHPVGTYPHVLAWSETSTGIIYQMSLSCPGSNIYIEVGTSALIVRNDDIFSSGIAHYRIYNNE